MVSPQSDDEQFDFYLRFAKPLVLNLSDTSDRIKAAAWIRKLKDEAGNAALRTDYLKLLLFVLQRRKLIGPFASIPDKTKPLEPFPEEINLQDIAKNFVEIDKKVLKEAIEKGGFGEWPPYNVACSSDLKEYAASQDIPNFGVHIYFAISKDPIQNWEQKNKAIFPIGEKIEATNDFGLSTSISPNISSFVSQEPNGPASERSPKKREGGDGATDIPNRHIPLPSPPNPFDVENNITPTWGSNLMKVNDDVLEEDFREEDFDFNVSDRDMLDLVDEDIDLDTVEGISDLEDSFYLDGDKLKSPEHTPGKSPVPNLPCKTPPGPCAHPPSPTPSLPYKTPPVPTVNLPSPAPSLPYRTPPKIRPPDESLFDRSVDNAEMLDFMDESINLIDDEDIFFDDIALYLQDDHLKSPPTKQPCGSRSPTKATSPVQRYTQASPAPSLPYRTPPIGSPVTSSPYRTPLKSRTPCDADMLDYMDQSIDLVDDISYGDAAAFLQTDRLATPPRHIPCRSSSPKRTQQSPAPSLPYRTPAIRSPVTSSPYRTPLQSRTPCDADMLDYMDQSIDLVDDISYGDAAAFLQTDRLATPPRHIPCRSSSPKKTQQSPAPSLPYRTPPVRSPVTSSPYRTPLKSRTPCDADMLDYMDQSIDLVDDISYGDAAAFLQTDRLATPPRHKPCGTSSPMKSRSPRSKLPRNMHDQPCHSLEHGPTVLERSIEEQQMNQSGVGLGGDSFIAPESRNFRWLQNMPPGPGLPEDIQQNSELWESFGWWTQDPDEILQYIPPSPRDCGSPDLYAAERERWADVPPTPPIFSKDPQIQTGPGAQRIYAIEEFGMESFEEPVWTCAEQYIKYMPESPYQDPRDINRQTLDAAQYTNVCSEVPNEMFEAQGESEGYYFFADEQPPIDDLEVSFNAEDYQKMSRAQAAFEAIQHGPTRIGAPPTPPPPPPEDQIQVEEAMADVAFLTRTPPRFVFEPNFFSTPPAYDPNPRLNAADFDESITKYIEDEMKLITSNIPVTTPERSPSPKRKKRFLGDETLPNIEDVVVDANVICSPELKTPPRYYATPKKEIKWDTEIGELKQLSPLTSAYVGMPENERQARNAKRRQELATMYQQQFASPPSVQSPETPPHLIDEPIPGDLGSPIPPTKLPPPGWDWQSPPSSQKYTCASREIKTPTGLTPPKKMPAEVTMFYESPPQEIYSPPPSPSSALGALQFSPPARFNSPPSPVCSPGGRPVFTDWQPELVADDLDMEHMYPENYEDLMAEEIPELYTSPIRAQSPETFELDETRDLSPTSRQKYYDAEIEALENEIFQEPSTPVPSCSRIQSQSPRSPVTPEYERRIWKENLKLHDLQDYWRREWDVRPMPRKSKTIKRFTVGPRLGTIPDQEEPCSPQRIPESVPAVHTNLEAQQEELRRAEEEAMRKARQDEANRSVMQDIEDLSRITYRTPPRRVIYAAPDVDQEYIDAVNRDLREIEASCQRYYLKERIRDEIQSQYASPPRPCVQPTVHPFDESLPEENNLPTALLPPSGWTWKTPPRYKMSDHKPREKRTPTGLESPEKMSEVVTMFYESPPHEFLSPPSPGAAVSALQYTPTCGFNLPASPIRSPGGRPITANWQFDDIIDDIDIDQVYPAEFEDIYEEEMPELYMSPPKVCGTENIRQEINISFPKTPCQQSSSTTRPTTRPHSPVTPEQERKMWKEKVRQHELHNYGKKAWTVRPKPRISKKVKRFTPRPGLHTISDEAEQLTPEQQQPTQNIENETITPEMQAEIDAAVRGLEAAKEVLRDIMELPEVVTFPPRVVNRHIILHNPNSDLEYVLQQIMATDELLYEVARTQQRLRIRDSVIEQFGSPPRAASPEPTVHPLDEPLPEDLPLPTALLPPSGWTWKTPEKYKMPDHKPREKYSPKVCSPDAPFSEDVTMFYESPPREFFSPTSPNAPVQDYSPLAQSPIQMHLEDNIYLDDLMDDKCIQCIDDEEHPELYFSPTKDTSPIQIQSEQTSPTNEAPTMSLEEQIAALECQCFGERITTPTRTQRVDELPSRDIQSSPETPEYKRQLWKDSVQLHEFNADEYPKRSWTLQLKPMKKITIPRYYRRSRMQTISDAEEPSTSKVSRADIIKAEKQMQESRRIYEEAQKEAMLDILKLQELAQAGIPKKSTCYQGISQEAKEKLKEEIAKRVHEQFSSPPQNIQQSEPIMAHPFDEELPPDLPSALLPPSGWGWKTPPHFQHRPFVETRTVSPTGVSPPPRPDPESLLYESPPQFSPEEGLEDICLPCTPIATSSKAPLKSPKERVTQSSRESPIPTSESPPTTHPEMPKFTPIKSPVHEESHVPEYTPIPFDGDKDQIYSTCLEDIDEEYPPEELSTLPSPPPSNIPEPMSDEEYSLIIDAEMREVDNILQSIPYYKTNIPCSPPTPPLSRRHWQEELAARPPLRPPPKSWTVNCNKRRAYTVRKSKRPDLSPVKERYLEWSPEVVYEPSIRSPSPSPIATTPTRHPQMPPENWTWKTPSPQALKATHQKLVEEGALPLMTPTRDGPSSEIFNESPPDIPQSPPDMSPINVCSPCSESVVSSPRKTPELYYSLESESPIRSPDISPYSSPLRSPGGRPVVPEWDQTYDDDFYFSKILPCQQELVDEEAPPEEIYEASLPPTPPPLPATPKPYQPQIRLTPRTRPKPNISMFSPERSPRHSPDIAYQSPMSPCRPPETHSPRRGPTPESAKRPYEPSAELVRFEPKRPAPQPSPAPEYQTPTRAQFGPRRRRKINRDAPRRRLVFEEDTDYEVEDIQNLQRAMETTAPCGAMRDVDAESPPRDADISVLTEFEFEPPEFNIFEEDNAEQYNIRLPFEGQRYTSDGSPIPVTDRIPEEEKDFKWLSCGSSCSTPKR